MATPDQAEEATGSAVSGVRPVLWRLGWAAGLVGGAAAVLSMWGSWIPSLWGDEAASVLSAMRPVGSLFSMLLHVDAVHGLYYLGLHGWIRLFGASPFSVRFPSAIAAGTCAAAVAWMCGRVRGIGFAVTAGLVIAVLPRMTYAGEEARSYAFDAALAALLCVIVVEIVVRRSRSRRWWVLYAVVLTVGIYAFLYFALMALAVGAAVALLPELRPQLRRWLLASTAAALAASPLLLLAATEAGQIAFLADRNVVNANSVLVQMWFGSVWFAVIAGAVIAVAGVEMLIDAVRLRRSTPVSPLRALKVLALCWLLIPMGLLLGVSPVISGYTARYGTFAAPAAAVLIASGLSRWARSRRPLRGLAVGMAVALLVAAEPVWSSQRTPYAKNQSDWNQIAAVIHTRAEPGDAIVFDETSRLSRRPRLAMNTNPAPFEAVRDVTLKSPYPKNPIWYDTVYSVREAAALGRLDGVRRAWVVEYKTAGSTDTWGIGDLRALGFHQRIRVENHRSVIYLYERERPTELWSAADGG